MYQAHRCRAMTGTIHNLQAALKICHSEITTKAPPGESRAGKTKNTMPQQKTSDDIYALCEAVADIAFIAGQRGYYSGDSRADVFTLIELANRFEQENKGVEWGQDGTMDYNDAIDNFCDIHLSREEVRSI